MGLNDDNSAKQSTNGGNNEEKGAADLAAEFLESSPTGVWSLSARFFKGFGRVGAWLTYALIPILIAPFAVSFLHLHLLEAGIGTSVLAEQPLLKDQVYGTAIIAPAFLWVLSFPTSTQMRIAGVLGAITLWVATALGSLQPFVTFLKGNPGGFHGEWLLFMGTTGIPLVTGFVFSLVYYDLSPNRGERTGAVYWFTDLVMGGAWTMLLLIASIIIVLPLGTAWEQVFPKPVVEMLTGTTMGVLAAYLGYMRAEPTVAEDEEKDLEDFDGDVTYPSAFVLGAIGSWLYVMFSLGGIQTFQDLVASQGEFYSVVVPVLVLLLVMVTPRETPVPSNESETPLEQ